MDINENLHFLCLPSYETRKFKKYCILGYAMENEYMGNGVLNI